MVACFQINGILNCSKLSGVKSLYRIAFDKLFVNDNVKVDVMKLRQNRFLQARLTGQMSPDRARNVNCLRNLLAQSGGLPVKRVFTIFLFELSFRVLYGIPYVIKEFHNVHYLTHNFWKMGSMYVEIRDKSIIPFSFGKSTFGKFYFVYALASLHGNAYIETYVK